MGVADPHRLARGLEEARAVLSERMVREALRTELPGEAVSLAALLSGDDGLLDHYRRWGRWILSTRAKGTPRDARWLAQCLDLRRVGPVDTSGAGTPTQTPTDALTHAAEALLDSRRTEEDDWDSAALREGGRALLTVLSGLARGGEVGAPLETAAFDALEACVTAQSGRDAPARLFREGHWLTGDTAWLEAGAARLARKDHGAPREARTGALRWLLDHPERHRVWRALPVTVEPGAAGGRRAVWTAPRRAARYRLRVARVPVTHPGPETGPDPRPGTGGKSVPFHEAAEIFDPPAPAPPGTRQHRELPGDAAAEAPRFASLRYLEVGSAFPAPPTVSAVVPQTRTDSSGRGPRPLFIMGGVAVLLGIGLARVLLGRGRSTGGHGPD